METHHSSRRRASVALGGVLGLGGAALHRALFEDFQRADRTHYQPVRHNGIVVLIEVYTDEQGLVGPRSSGTIWSR